MFDYCNGFIKWNMAAAAGQKVAGLTFSTPAEESRPRQSRDERSVELSSST